MKNSIQSRDFQSFRFQSKSNPSFIQLDDTDTGQGQSNNYFIFFSRAYSTALPYRVESWLTYSHVANSVESKLQSDIQHSPSVSQLTLSKITQNHKTSPLGIYRFIFEIEVLS